MNSNMTNELVLLTKFFTTPKSNKKLIQNICMNLKVKEIDLPFTLKFANVVMEDFDMPLQLKKCPPRFVWTYLTGIADFVQVSLLNVHSHFSSTFEFVAANILSIEALQFSGQQFKFFSYLHNTNILPVRGFGGFFRVCLNFLCFSEFFHKCCRANDLRFCWKFIN